MSVSLDTNLGGLDRRKQFSTIGKNSFNFMRFFVDIIVFLWILLKRSNSFLFFPLKIFLVPTMEAVEQAVFTVLGFIAALCDMYLVMIIKLMMFLLLSLFSKA